MIMFVTSTLIFNITIMDTIACILEQQCIVDDLKVTCDDNTIGIEEYKEYIKSQIFSFAMNVALVLSGDRLAYISDIMDRNVDDHVKKTLFEYDKNIMEYKFKWNCQFIILKKNLEQVKNMLSVYNNDLRINVGEVLGYKYDGEDWCDLYIDRYSIKYMTQYNNDTYNLYSFMIPTSKYNVDIQQKILKDLDKYENTLNSYGISVSIKYDFHQRINENNMYIIPILCSVAISLIRFFYL